MKRLLGLMASFIPWTLTVVAAFVGTTSIYAQGSKPTSISEFVRSRLSRSSPGSEKTVTFTDICPITTDMLALRIFSEYGAVFVANDGVAWPSKCIFSSEEELALFQKGLKSKTALIGGVSVELQDAAMDALQAAIKEAAERGLNITPRGASASRRSFADTQRIWDSRFFPGLEYWVSKGKISAADAQAARKMNIPDQVRRVLEWESKGYFFSTGKDRTILSSVAAPGTSQHLSMLALDVSQFANAAVREILNRHGWFQTVANDTPHFTYLGVPEIELPSRGLRLVTKNGYKFWVPNMN